MDDQWCKQWLHIQDRTMHGSFKQGNPVCITVWGWAVSHCAFIVCSGLILHRFSMDSKASLFWMHYVYTVFIIKRPALWIFNGRPGCMHCTVLINSQLLGQFFSSNLWKYLTTDGIKIHSLVRHLTNPAPQQHKCKKLKMQDMRGRIDGWMDGWKDRWTDGQTHSWMSF